MQAIQWFDSLYKEIQQGWQYTGPAQQHCLKFFRTKKWLHCHFAPANQEIYSGAEDGKRFWQGFSFDINVFLGKNFSIDSLEFHAPNTDSKLPAYISFKGFYRGNKTHIRIFSKPPTMKAPAELIDKSKGIIR